MAEITLKGRRIPLLYTTYEMKAIQEDIAPLGKFQYLIAGRNPDNPEDTEPYGSPGHLGAIASLIRILGNAGLEEAGETADLTDKTVLRALKPTRLAEAIITCTKAIHEGMLSEIPKENDGGPVDVTLEEIERKKENPG